MSSAVGNRGARRTIRRLLIPMDWDSLAKDVQDGFLTERQRMVLCMFYGFGCQPMSMQKVADVLQVDRKGAAKMRDAALLKLYERHLSQGVETFTDET